MGLRASAVVRTNLHYLLMPIARRQLRSAKTVAATGRQPLGHVAAFVLLAVAALEFFVNAVWEDKLKSARSGFTSTQWKHTKLADKLRAVGEGTDNRQVVSARDLQVLERLVDHRHKLVQHPKAKFEGGPAPTTTVRMVLTVEYAYKAYESLRSAADTIHRKYYSEPKAQWVRRI